MSSYEWSISARLLGGKYYRAAMLQNKASGRTVSNLSDAGSTIPQSLGTGTSDDGIAKLYTSFVEIGRYKEQIYRALMDLEEYTLPTMIIEIMKDDVLSPNEATGEIFQISSDDKKYDAVLKGMESRLSLDQLINEICADLLLFGEYPLKIFSNLEQIESLEELMNPWSIVPMYQNLEIVKYLVKTGGTWGQFGGGVRQVSPGDFVMFLRNPKKMRVIPSEYHAYLTRGTMKVGRSIFPLQTLEKIKALALMESLIPLSRLLQLDRNTVLGVRLGQQMQLKQALSACREYERFLNTRTTSTASLDINQVVNNIGKYKVLPILGDKGTVEEMPVNPPEMGDLNDIVDMRNQIVTSVGLPPSYVFGETGATSMESLKSYVRYLRKLESVQSCLKEGLKHLGLIELYLHGFNDAVKSDIDVTFSNIVSIANIERLEFLDILVSLLGNYTNFIGTLKEMPGAEDYIDTLAMIQFVYGKLKHFPGAEAPLKVTDLEEARRGTDSERLIQDLVESLPKGTRDEAVKLLECAWDDLKDGPRLRDQRNSRSPRIGREKLKPPYKR
jgi:hypothetical protein